jgi:hypothetical protein
VAQIIIIAEGIEIRDKQGSALTPFLNANCDAKTGATSTFTYPKGAGAKATHEVRIVFTKGELATAIDTTDAFVVYEGHSRFGQGPAFGPPNTPHVPDVKAFPTNPWGVHFRMGYDGTDTECVGDLMEHSVTPAEFDITAAAATTFLPAVLVRAAKNAQAQAKVLKGKTAAASCSTGGAWRLFNTCWPKVAAAATARGDKPLDGRHYFDRLPRKVTDEFTTSVRVGSADLDKSALPIKLLFMASCSSHVHFFEALDRRRKASKSNCKFLLTGDLCATYHATNFLTQVLVKGIDPMTPKGEKTLVKALNGVSGSGRVGVF